VVAWPRPRIGGGSDFDGIRRPPRNVLVARRSADRSTRSMCDPHSAVCGRCRLRPPCILRHTAEQMCPRGTGHQTPFMSDRRREMKSKRSPALSAQINWMQTREKCSPQLHILPERSQSQYNLRAEALNKELTSKTKELNDRDYLVLHFGLGTLCRRESGLLRRLSHFGGNWKLTCFKKNIFCCLTRRGNIVGAAASYCLRTWEAPRFLR